MKLKKKLIITSVCLVCLFGISVGIYCCLLVPSSPVYAISHFQGDVQLNAYGRAKLRNLIAETLEREDKIICTALDDLGSTELSVEKIECKKSQVLNRLMAAFAIEEKCRIVNNDFPSCAIGLVIFCPAENIRIYHALWHKTVLIHFPEHNRLVVSTLSDECDAIMHELREKVIEHGVSVKPETSSPKTQRKTLELEEN